MTLSRNITSSIAATANIRLTPKGDTKTIFKLQDFNLLAKTLGYLFFEERKLLLLQVM